MIQLGEDVDFDTLARRAASGTSTATQHPDDAKAMELIHQMRSSGLSDECIISVVRAAVRNGTMQADGAARMLALAGLADGPPLYKRTWFKITAGVLGGLVVGFGLGWALKD